MTLLGPVPDSLISSRDRCSTHRSRFLSFRDRSRPAGTGPGKTATGDFPPTTLRTCSRTYRGSCRVLDPLNSIDNQNTFYDQVRSNAVTELIKNVITRVWQRSSTATQTESASSIQWAEPTFTTAHTYCICFWIGLIPAWQLTLKIWEIVLRRRVSISFWTT